MATTRLFFISIFIILLIGCEKTDNKNSIDENTEITTINIKESENQQDLDELKKNMGNNKYGVKKETLTISDTFNNIQLKINYPLIYVNNENKIEFLDYISSDILDLLITDIYGLYCDDFDGRIKSNDINRIQNSDENTPFDYKTAYKDDYFLSIDYSWNFTDLLEVRSYVSDLCINLIFEYEDNSIYVKLITDRKDIIDDIEILDFIKNKKFEQVSGVDEVMEPFVDELNKTGDIPLGYHLTNDVLLKSNNILEIFI